MDVSVSTYVATTLSAFLITSLGAFFVREKTKSEANKNKAETENLVALSLQTALTEMRTEREGDRRIIEDSRRIIREQELANEDCEYKHEVAQLQIKQLIQQTDWNNIPKATIFVVDDNKMVIIDFRNRFKNIPTIDCRFFFLVSDFLAAAAIERPEVVILDYMLGEDMTAEDVIKQMGYMPEVFIMSQDKSIQLRIRDMGMQFFYKDEHYVMKIAAAVIRHLNEKVG